MLYKYDIDTGTYTFVSQSPYSSGQSITPAESFVNASEQKLYIKYNHAGNEWYQTYDIANDTWNEYNDSLIISNYIEEGDSVLDFGCARGDFEKFYEQEYQSDIDYIGVDMNQQLIEAGRKVYNEEVELVCSDWFSIDDDIEQDWCININSNNIRYDFDTNKSDIDYLNSKL